MMDVLDQFLQSISYKFPKGYPDIDNEEDKKKLFEMVSLLIEEKEPFTKSDLINLINSKEISDKLRLQKHLTFEDAGSKKIEEMKEYIAPIEQDWIARTYNGYETLSMVKEILKEIRGQ